jgi:hypothetical protein
MAGSCDICQWMCWERNTRKIYVKRYANFTMLHHLFDGFALITINRCLESNRRLHEYPVEKQRKLDLIMTVQRLVLYVH